MPLYEYKCSKCFCKLVELQNVDDEPLTICPKCEGKLNKVFSICDSDVDYKDGKEYYENVIKKEVKEIVNKIKAGDENATADVFGEKFFNKG